MNHKYKATFPQRMLNYFSTWQEKAEAAEGEKKKEFRGIPSFTKFAKKIGVSPRTLYRWATPGTDTYHPEFEEAYHFCKCILADLLADGALAGDYEPKFTKYLRETVCGRAVEGPGEGTEGGVFDCRIAVISNIPQKGEGQSNG